MKTETQKKRMCCNCTHGGKGIKIIKLTHHVCTDPKVFNDENFENEIVSPWDALMVFSDSCERHEFKKQGNEKK